MEVNLTQIGELLKNIINKTVLETAQEHNRLYNNWNGIVEEAFRKKKYKEYASDFDIYKIERELINAKKAADHSGIKSIKNETLYVEVDHPGWIQILQTKQHNILRIVQRRFPELKINAIAFVLKEARNDIAESQPELQTEEALKPSTETPQTNDTTTDDFIETELANIHDEEFKQILREFGKRAVK
jgi:hypothetical protein